MSDLDRRLRNHYGAEALSEHSLAKAREALSQPVDGLVGEALGDREPTQAETPTLVGIWHRSAYARAAIFIIALGLGFVWLEGRLVERRWQAQLNGIAEEVALNHNKQLDLEFETEAIDALPMSMTRLDFTPVASEKLALADLAVEGARYCSLGGSIAAQVRLRDAGGRAVTLYQVQAPERPQRLGGLLDARTSEVFEGELDGVSVRLWHEAGLLMGIARAAQ